VSRTRHETPQENRIFKAQGESRQERAEGVEEVVVRPTKSGKANRKDDTKNDPANKSQHEQSQANTGEKNEEDRPGCQAIHKVQQAEYKQSTARCTQGNSGTQEKETGAPKDTAKGTEGRRTSEDAKRVDR